MTAGMCGTQEANTKPFKKKIAAIDQRIAAAWEELRAPVSTFRLPSWERGPGNGYFSIGRHTSQSIPSEIKSEELRASVSTLPLPSWERAWEGAATRHFSMTSSHIADQPAMENKVQVIAPSDRHPPKKILVSCSRR